MKKKIVIQIIIYSLILLFIGLLIDVVLSQISGWNNIIIDTAILRDILSAIVFFYIVKSKEIVAFNWNEKISIASSIKDIKIHLIIMVVGFIIFRMSKNIIYINTNWYDGFITNYVKSRNEVVLILDYCFVGPILEEIFFRGFILKKIKNAFTKRQAVLFSAMIFSIIHIEPNQMLRALFFGLIAGKEFYENNKIFNVMLLHTIWNILVVVTAFLFYK